MARVMLSLEGVVKTLGSRRILDGLDWSLHEGECAVILGPSGGGKTVFLHTLLGLLPPDAGRVTAPGLDADNPFATIAVMFQEDALLDDRTVEANLAIALEERADLFRGPFAPATERAIDEVLREVRLDPGQVRRALPSATLSGGMRRRVALARALIRRPKILIADEPTTGLDASAAARVYDLLGGLIARHGMSAVIITHDPACASRLGFPVYYFSPHEGRMPRWPAPSAEPAAGGDHRSVSGDDRHEARHRDLLLWMHEQIAAHARRTDAAPAENNAGGEGGPPPPTAMGRWIARVAELPGQTLDALGRVGLLLTRLGRGASSILLLRGLADWGLKTLPLTAIIFLMLGVVLQIQAETAMVEYGLSSRLPELVALSLLRLAPIVVGFLMAGRCGSAITAQVGWLQLAGQFRALRTMRINPDGALFAPLFWSLTAATPLLMLAGLGIGAAGAMAALASPVSRAEITLTYFSQSFPEFITLAELAVAILKALLMGAGLAVIAYGGGAGPKQSPADVTAAITRGLVGAFLWTTLVDTVVSLAVPV